MTRGAPLIATDTHRRILIGAYLALGVYAGAQLLVSYEQILNTQIAFFHPARLYAYLSFSLIALAPASCLFVAFALHKRYHGGVLVAPALHAAVVLMLYGAVLALYLSGWYFARGRASAP